MLNLSQADGEDADLFSPPKPPAVAIFRRRLSVRAAHAARGRSTEQAAQAATGAGALTVRPPRRSPGPLEGA